MCQGLLCCDECSSGACANGIPAEPRSGGAAEAIKHILPRHGRQTGVCTLLIYSLLWCVQSCLALTMQTLVFKCFSPSLCAKSLSYFIEISKIHSKSDGPCAVVQELGQARTGPVSQEGLVSRRDCEGQGEGAQPAGGRCRAERPARAVQELASGQ